MIHPASHSAGHPGVIQPSGPKPAALTEPAPMTAGDTLDTTGGTALRESLAALPEVRPDAVEQGKKLAMDPNYPPRAIIENIARLFINSQDLTNQA